MMCSDNPYFIISQFTCIAEVVMRLFVLLLVFSIPLAASGQSNPAIEIGGGITQVIKPSGVRDVFNPGPHLVLGA